VHLGIPALLEFYRNKLNEESLVLGPRARRDRLCTMAEWNGRPVKGRVGLDIGAELPQPIALSVAAEIHADLNHRDGRSLTDKLKQL
jgi:hypothetical protein